MMSYDDVAVACNLFALDQDERAREGMLLEMFRSLPASVEWTGSAHRMLIPNDAATLAGVGELLALERRCCPFLHFSLEVNAADHAVLTISGPHGSREFVEETFAVSAGE